MKPEPAASCRSPAAAAPRTAEAPPAARRPPGPGSGLSGHRPSSPGRGLSSNLANQERTGPDGQVEQTLSCRCLVTTCKHHWTTVLRSLPVGKSACGHFRSFQFRFISVKHLIRQEITCYCNRAGDEDQDRR